MKPNEKSPNSQGFFGLLFRREGLDLLLQEPVWVLCVFSSEHWVTKSSKASQLKGNI